MGGHNAGLGHVERWATKPFDADTDERFVVVAGDWHSDLVHLTSNVPALLKAGFLDGSDQPSTLLHVGDVNITNGSRQTKRVLLEMAKLAELRRMRILITPGNHDSWARLDARADFAAGRPTRLVGAVWALPRGFRFRMGGREIVSFGGAGSIKRPVRGENITWWPREMPTESEVDECVSKGPAEVAITHEAPWGGSDRVDRILARSHLEDPLDQAYTDGGRDRITRLWEGLSPRLLFHGHHHIQAEGHHPDGRSVYSLGKNREPGNLASIDLRDMSVQWLPSRK